MRIDDLDQAIKAVCPIDGVCADGRIDFKPGATDKERAAAQSIMDAELQTLDLSPPPEKSLADQIAELPAQDLEKIKARLK